MVSMEISMNLTDYYLTGGAQLTYWVVPIMLTDRLFNSMAL